MNLLITIISLFILGLFLINQHIKNRRRIYILELSSCYDAIEFFFVKNNITLDKGRIDLLKVYKRYVANPELLDIQVLLAIKKIAEKTGHLNDSIDWHKKATRDLPKDFYALSKDFDVITDKIIRLSEYKPDFIWYIFRRVLANSFRLKLRVQKAVKRVQKDKLFIYRNEDAISYYGMKMSA